MSLRTLRADAVPAEEQLVLAKLINTLPETSSLREALAYILESVSRGKNTYMFSYPTNTVEEPEDFDPDGGA